MITKTYYGKFQVNHFLNFLAATFRDQNLDVNVSNHGKRNVVRFVSSRGAKSGGQFALNLILTEFEGGVRIDIGTPEGLGVAASLGKTALFTLLNPYNLLVRLDDVAQDIENITLDQSLLKEIERYMRTNHLTLKLSSSLSKTVCEYCHSINDYGKSNCVSCGAPMGDTLLKTCPRCGFAMKNKLSRCPQCKAKA